MFNIKVHELNQDNTVDVITKSGKIISNIDINELKCLKTPIEKKNIKVISLNQVSSEDNVDSYENEYEKIFDNSININKIPETSPTSSNNAPKEISIFERIK